MFEEELFNLSMRAIGGILKGAGKIGVNAIADTITDSRIVHATDTEPLPPVTTRLTASNRTNNSSNIHGFVFGEQLGQVVAKDETADGHIMVVGGVGSGKSSCVAIPSLLAWNKRVFAIDIKGELHAAVSKYKTKTADNVRLFNPLSKSGETFGYDPFYLLRTTDNQVQEAQAIAHALIPLPQDIKDPFWVQSSQNMFAGAILHFYNLGYSFIDTVTKILSTRIDDLIAEIHASETFEARFFVQSFIDMDIKTLSGIFTELCNNIMIFATDRNIKESLSKMECITPEDLEYGADIYIHIPEHLLRQWKNLLTLMVSQFLRHFERREEMTSTPILFLLDEFARLGKIEGITDGLATLRSKKITICIILQSLAQLDLLYGKETRQVIADTCQYKAILNATDAESQQYFSKLVGTYEKYKVINSQQFERFTNFKAGSSITQTTEEKPIIKPEEFATLNQIVLLSPFGVFKVDKKPYYKNLSVPQKSCDFWDYFYREKMKI